MAVRLARRAAEIYSDLVLDRVRAEERELEEVATRGRTVQWGRDNSPTHASAERYVDDLHRREPVFALVRAWCGAERAAGFDEAAALRAQIERLRTLVLAPARRLGDAGHLVVAARLRKELAADPGQRL